MKEGGRIYKKFFLILLKEMSENKSDNQLKKKIGIFSFKTMREIVESQRLFYFSSMLKKLKC